MQIDQFLSRWRHAGGSERANYQLFIADLRDLPGEGPWKKRLPQRLKTLVALGRARMSDDGRFGASK